MTTPGLHAGQHRGCTVCDAAHVASSIEQQERDAWSRCADCGELGRKHSANSDHPFRIPEEAKA